MGKHCKRTSLNPRLLQLKVLQWKVVRTEGHSWRQEVLLPFKGLWICFSRRQVHRVLFRDQAQHFACRRTQVQSLEPPIQGSQVAGGDWRATAILARQWRFRWPRFSSRVGPHQAATSPVQRLAVQATIPPQGGDGMSPPASLSNRACESDLLSWRGGGVEVVEEEDSLFASPLRLQRILAAAKAFPTNVRHAANGLQLQIHTSFTQKRRGGGGGGT